MSGAVRGLRLLPCRSPQLFSQSVAVRRFSTTLRSPAQALHEATASGSTSLKESFQCTLDFPTRVAARMSVPFTCSVTRVKGEEREDVSHVQSLRVGAFSSLSARHQEQLKYLEQLLARAAQQVTQTASSAPSLPRPEGGSTQVFVVCSATSELDGDHPQAPHHHHHHYSSDVHDSTAGKMVTSTGVNHAFHRSMNPEGGTLRGILKGCAEQNMFGMVAAQGLPYISITNIYFMSTTTTTSQVQANSKASDDSCASCSTCVGDHTEKPRTGGASFPCAECWRHLAHVGHLRQHKGLTPLRLFVRILREEPSAIHVLSIAQQRLKERPAPVEVILVT